MAARHPPITITKGALVDSTAEPSAIPPAESGLVLHPDGLLRCWWCGRDPDYVAYHDLEWGRPERDGHKLFEKLCLEGFQAGLSWLTILRRREAFRAAFHGFDPQRVARMESADVERLVTDATIIRHRGKIEATIANARIVTNFADLDAFSAFIWDHAPEVDSSPTSAGEVATASPESHALAASLRALGWKFLGPTSAYAFLQSMGMVNDHLVGCHAQPGAAHGEPPVR
ncbi:MAG: DNA-3-methyladenine glycosylase I [Nitriliruptoraceae bacterium]